MDPVKKGIMIGMLLGKGAKLGPKMIDENGDYDPKEEDPPLDGYSSVSVGVTTYEDELNQIKEALGLDPSTSPSDTVDAVEETKAAVDECMNACAMMKTVLALFIDPADIPDDCADIPQTVEDAFEEVQNRQHNDDLPTPPEAPVDPAPDGQEWSLNLGADGYKNISVGYEIGAYEGYGGSLVFVQVLINTTVTYYTEYGKQVSQNVGTTMSTAQFTPSEVPGWPDAPSMPVMTAVQRASDDGRLTFDYSASDKMTISGAWISTAGVITSWSNDYGYNS